MRDEENEDEGNDDRRVLCVLCGALTVVVIGLEKKKKCLSSV